MWPLLNSPNPGYSENYDRIITVKPDCRGHQFVVTLVLKVPPLKPLFHHISHTPPYCPCQMARIKETSSRLPSRPPPLMALPLVPFHQPGHTGTTLCSVCRDVTRRISRKIYRWPKIVRRDLYNEEAEKWVAGAWPQDPNAAMRLFNEPSARPAPKLLPSNVIKHIAHARDLIRSGRRCDFCAMIRDAIVVAHALQQSRLTLEDLPLKEILAASEAHAVFLLDPLYSKSRVFLSLTRFRRPYFREPCTLQNIEVVLATSSSHLATFSEYLRGYIAVAAVNGTRSSTPPPGGSADG